MSSMSERKEGSQTLQELDALSQSLYQAHAARRTASLALPRSSVPAAAAPAPAPDNSRPRSRRLSMSPWRSRPKSSQHHHHHDDGDGDNDVDDDCHRHHTPVGAAAVAEAEAASSGEKKGIWKWKPMRALSHIGMQRLGCLFSVEVVAVQGLPASMNGLRLSVSVRKKETKEGAVQTMPARVLQGSADFEETLFVRCHVYCSGGAGTGKPLRLEPRPFVISAVAIDAPELDFGRRTVDLSLLVKESMEKSLEGGRVRQWDTSFPLVGKAKGAELVLKVGFQIIEDGGASIYNQADAAAAKSSGKGRDSSLSFSFVRKRPKSSFSVASPKITRSEPSSTPTKDSSSHIDLKGIDEFSLDEPGPPESSPRTAQKPEDPEPEPEPEPKDDLDLPEFEVVDKGIEIQEDKEDEAGEGEAAESAENTDAASASSEVVKEVVHDSAHLTRLTELDAIAKQIKALESMMIGDEPPNSDTAKTAAQDDDDTDDNDNGPQQLDAEEETVTREFLQMLELEGSKEYSAEFDTPDRHSPWKVGARAGSESESGTYISDLGKGLGPVVQTRDGGFLAATNPFNTEVARKDPPKLAMQLSKPFVLADQRTASSGFEVFQRLAAIGPDELSSKLSSLAAMDELTGKTAEQIAFEGMASAIISGRSKEGASSSAARSVAALKTMAAAMSEGRKERVLTGIWNVREEPVLVEEILAFSLQKIEAMAVEALKIQADMAEEQAPFDVSPLVNSKQQSGDDHPLDSAVPQEEWGSACAGAEAVTLLVAVQLRDPLRRYETVGAPTIAVVQAARAGGGGDEEEEGRFKVGSLHVGGLKLRAAGGGGRRSAWDGERQRLTAMQWLVAYGLGKGAAAGGKKARAAQAKGGKDVVWSMSSRVMADMWLKPMRNPDVKITEQ